MRQFGGFDRSAGKFAGDRRGSFAIVFGVAAPVLALAVGLCVNVAQLMNAQSALKSAVDSAVTSTTRDLTTGHATPDEADDTVKAFLTANSAGGILGYDRIVLDRATVDRAARTLEVTAHVDVDLFFPLFGMGDMKRVSNTSAAIYSDKKIEVAMMLDITGSMQGHKIEDLKAAATNAVGLLLPDSQDPQNPRVRVAIVPYAEAVNVGALARDTVFYEEKGGPDLPPAIDAPILASAEIPASTPLDTCATERKNADGTADFSDDSPYSERRNGKYIYLAKVNRDDRITETKNRKGEVTGTTCPKAALTPLTADKEELLATIDDFKADGVTAGGIAAQWGYYMLSPKWRSAIKDANAGDGPADFNKDKIAKVAILMTDGQFNTAFAGVGERDTPQNRQGTKSRRYAESICANMKADGIAVFTIGFALGSSEKSEARAVLKNCSSPNTSSMKHFYDVSTGPELDAAFKEIIANTERLALTR